MNESNNYEKFPSETQNVLTLTGKTDMKGLCSLPVHFNYCVGQSSK